MSGVDPSVGILAYGSLISDPREEIQNATIHIKKGIMTPFNVEFARTSRTRAGAPTLVPVKDGGARVPAWIFVLNIPENEAANCLWRRETGSVGSERTYNRPTAPGPNSVVIARIENFGSVDVVLYTDIAPNISELTPARLALLAIESARSLSNGRDGITYLIKAKANGVLTPLSALYEQEIKQRLDAVDLEDALGKARTAIKTR